MNGWVSEWMSKLTRQKILSKNRTCFFPSFPNWEICWSALLFQSWSYQFAFKLFTQYDHLTGPESNAQERSYFPSFNIEVKESFLLFPMSPCLPCHSQFKAWMPLIYMLRVTLFLSWSWSRQEPSSISWWGLDTILSFVVSLKWALATQV